MGLLLMEGIRDIEESRRLYEERLEKNKPPKPVPGAKNFIRNIPADKKATSVNEPRDVFHISL